MKPWRELFFEEVETPHHFHIGMRIIKTVLAVFACSIIGWLRGEMTFFSMIAAVLCMQNSAEKTFTTSFNRIIGTALGGLYGVVVLFIETHVHAQNIMPLYCLIVSLMLIPVILTTILIKKPSVAAFSCVVFLSTTIYHVGDADPYTYALNRMLDTAIGIVVALIVNLAMPGPKQRRIWTVQEKNPHRKKTEQEAPGSCPGASLSKWSGRARGGGGAAGVCEHRFGGVCGLPLQEGYFPPRRAGRRFLAYKLYCRYIGTFFRISI